MAGDPADVGGAILSVDRTDEWGEWPWAGPEWRSHIDTSVVNEVLAVTIEASDPPAMAVRWAELLGLDVTADSDVREVSFGDGGAVRFVPAGTRGEGVSGFTLRSADGATRSVSICNCRFDLVP